ncbi:MAG: RsmE family RNA methyltransferase [Nannocystaceae bacterium]|nr:16S rRNA (uracil(1498)-N(3))-methyltransferase [Myxococcales bacterium]
MSLRVFVDPPVTPGAELTLDADESHYLCRVRRAGADAACELIDGTGGLWAATVRRADPRAAIVVADARLEPVGPARSVELWLGLPEAPACLEALTRASELGVSAITLVACARSQGRAPTPARIDRVLRAAQRQCGRPRPPIVAGPRPLAAALADARTHEVARFVAWEALRGASAGAPTLAPGAPALLLVGPPGGFTEPEIAAVRDERFTALGLGPWTLRTETAAIVGLTRLLFA